MCTERVCLLSLCCFSFHRHDDVTPSWFRALESHVLRVPNGNGIKVVFTIFSILTICVGLVCGCSTEAAFLFASLLCNDICGIDASKILDYSSSIVSGFSLSNDRVVFVVGWGNDASEGKYWIVCNSGREFWREQEYIRVKAGWFSNLALGQQCAWFVPRLPWRP